MLRSYGVVLVVALAAGPWAVTGEFEGLSTSELENLLHNIDYAGDYSTGDQYPDYVLNGPEPDYYGDYRSPDLVDPVEPLEPVVEPVVEPNNYDQDLDEFLAFPEQRQEETLSHGSPLGLGHSGTTKANPKNAGAVLPAYCDPPNPCPLGYTEKDGCLEQFENTSEFSRNYQARQNCLCDSEHMFNCPSNERQTQQQQHQQQQDESFLAGMPPSLESELENDNPFLSGHKLPIAAKKGLGF